MILSKQVVGLAIQRPSHGEGQWVLNYRKLVGTDPTGAELAIKDYDESAVTKTLTLSGEEEYQLQKKRVWMMIIVFAGKN